MDVPKYNDQGAAIVYTLKTPVVSGIQADVSSSDEKTLTVAYTNRTYYYQDDFNDQDWGIFKTFGTVSFDGAAGNHWLKYTYGTSTVTLDDAVLSASNLVFEMKVMVADDYVGGIDFRYDSDGSSNNNTSFLAINKDKDVGLKYSVSVGPRGSFCPLTPNRWTTIKVVLDFTNRTCTYY